MEGLLLQIGTDDADTLCPFHIHIGEKTPFFQLASHHGGAFGGVVEGFSHTVDGGAFELVGATANQGTGLDIGGDAGKILGIFCRQCVHIVGIHTAGGAAAKNVGLHQIGAHLLELAVHVVLHPVAQTGDDDDGTHADDDAQHGEEGTHFAGQQAFDGETEGLGEIHGATSSLSSAVTTARGSRASPS